MGPTKTRRVFVRVSDEQHALMKAKAAAYGVTLSRLVLVAVEAYARTYDEWPEGDCIVAVNYGVWGMVGNRLQGIEDELRAMGRQLGALRRTLHSSDASGAATDAVVATQRDVARILADAERCTQALDHISEMTHLVDPYLGPLVADDPSGTSEVGD